MSAFFRTHGVKKYAGQKWPRRSWMRALEKSRSGQRLRFFWNLNIWFDNTTREVGDNPDSQLPPDVEHMCAVLKRRKPESVIAFGNQAAEVVQRIWDGPLLMVPHPTYRLVTNNLYLRAAEILKEGFEGKIQLKQLPKKILIVGG